MGLAASILAFLVFGYYTRRSRVDGQLVPAAGVLLTHAHAAGLVSQVSAHEGEHVHRGDRLLEISGEIDSAALGNVRVDISKRLRAQRVRLESDLSTQRQSSLEQSHQLKRQRVLLQAQRQQIHDQRALQLQRVDSDRKLLKRIQPLGEKSYVSAY